MIELRDLAAFIADWWNLRRVRRCPRCDYDAAKRLTPYGDTFSVVCLGCEVYGPPGATRRRAVDAWNSSIRREQA